MSAALIKICIYHLLIVNHLVGRAYKFHYDESMDFLKHEVARNGHSISLHWDGNPNNVAFKQVVII